MPGRVVIGWQHKEQEVTSEFELTNLLSRIRQEAEEHKFGFMVDLVLESGACLTTAFGRPYSFMGYGDQGYISHYSKGNRNLIADEQENGDPGCASVVFMYRGSWSQFPREHLIPFDEAYKLLLNFYLSKQLPHLIEWIEQ